MNFGSVDLKSKRVSRSYCAASPSAVYRSHLLQAHTQIANKLGICSRNKLICDHMQALVAAVVGDPLVPWAAEGREGGAARKVQPSG